MGTMKFHNHQVHSYDAKKSIPPSVVSGLTPAGKKVKKRQHTKKRRQRQTIEVRDGKLD